ncbi:MAG: ABC transporter permease [Deltaproteobacteria bacterium]|nr:ABC transporter permease [Deltaproteobacteria bacterium]
MPFKDIIGLSWGALMAYRMRSFLTALGISVGIAAVVLLTSIGEGVHRFVLAEFTQFGTNLLAVVPGKTATFGVSGAIVSTVRPLSLADGEALARIDGVVAVVPVVQGNALVEAQSKSRRAFVFGVGSAVPTVWRIKVTTGKFLPAEERGTARAFAVLGSKLTDELFGGTNPLGQRIRVGQERYRVIGVMERKGQFMGFDLDDAVYLPAERALELFNRESLMEIDLLYEPGASVDRLVTDIKRALVSRHGHEDFTIITQKQMLDVLGSILDVLTFAVAALGSISLLVGGVGVLTIMTIAVTERTSEIGLLRALGAERDQISKLFLTEAVVLAGAGGLGGLAAGVALGQILHALIPGLPVQMSWGYALAGEVLAIAVGLAAGVVPARRAAKLDPLEALRNE